MLKPMMRRITKTVFRWASQTPEPAGPKPPAQKVDPSKFDIFDYAGHKYSYEIDKNYGQFDKQQLWGERLIFANDAQMIQEKRKDWIMAGLFVAVCVGFLSVKFKMDMELLDAVENVLRQQYPNYDNK